MNELYSDCFMATYTSIMGVVGVMFAASLLTGIYLVCRNKELPVSYKWGWIVSMLALNVVALLVYLLLFSVPRKEKGYK